MSEKTSPTDMPAAASPVAAADERYRYIGFGVYPRRAEKFWTSDQERDQFLKNAKIGVGASAFERDNSLLQQEVMTGVDRGVLTITAVLMLATLLFPWVGFRTGTGTDVSMTWGAALGTLMGGLGTAFAGGLATGLSAVIGLVMLIGAPIVGLWLLALLWTKASSPEALQLRLRLPLKLGYVFLFAGLSLAILAAVGGHIPGYERWGLIDPGEQYGLGSFLGIASWGFYLTMALGMVLGVKSGDL
ncbi:MAG TPA: hypothetical protein VGB22_08155 [candidate division Zixibacteria bacterium]|jgi:hypothetical protein